MILTSYSPLLGGTTPPRNHLISILKSHYAFEAFQNRRRARRGGGGRLQKAMAKRFLIEEGGRKGYDPFP
jgi:hypothetical protein